MKKDLNIEAREAWIIIFSIIGFVLRYEEEVVSVDEDEDNNLNRRPVTVGVYDQGGNNYQQNSMEGTIPISPDRIAEKKALTAISTEEDGSVWTPHENEPNTGDQDHTPISGSVVLRAKNEVVGAVGVSGRKAEKEGEGGYPQDQGLALYARKVFERYLRFSEDIKENNCMMLVNSLLEDINPPLQDKVL